MKSKVKQPDLSGYTEEQLRDMAEKFAVSEREFPSLFTGLNVAQYRALKTIYTKDEKGFFPDFISIEFANGVGKSTSFIMDMIGWTMGPEYLKTECYPPEAIEFYESIAKQRDCGKLTMRLICESVDMKEGGSVLALLKQFFPWAKPSKPDNTGCYKQIDIPHPKIKGIVNHIAVFTFEQDPKTFAGANIDRTWINENLPDKHWEETNARTRSGGNIVQFATVLEYSNFLIELEDSEKFVLERCKGHVYENCIGEEVTDEMALEVFEAVGIRLEKNKEGRGYITHGVLSVEKIERLFDGYKDPNVVKARKTGTALSQGTKIFSLYDSDVHLIPDDSFANVPGEWPVVQIIDPHPARPDFSMWAMLLPSDRLIIVDEWPTYEEHGYFDKIKDSRYTLPQKAEIWKEFEASRGYTNRIVARIGDPNRFLEPDEMTGGTLRDLYSKAGFPLNISVNDNFEFGRELVNQYLWYDRNVRAHSPSDPSGKPRLSIYGRCVNVDRAMFNFRRKVVKDKSAAPSEAVDKRFECACACVRYLIVWHQNHHFSDVKIDNNRVSDYERIKQSRLPASKRSLSDKNEKYKGRAVVGSYKG